MRLVCYAETAITAEEEKANRQSHGYHPHAPVAGRYRVPGGRQTQRVCAVAAGLAGYWIYGRNLTNRSMGHADVR